MWVLLSIFGIGFAIYEIVTRDSVAAPPAPPSPNQQRMAANLTADQLRLKPDPAIVGQKALDAWYAQQNLIAWLKRTAAERAAICGVQSGDTAAADVWSAAYLGWHHSLEPRLQLMLNMVPFAQWPAAAKRLWCFYRGP